MLLLAPCPTCVREPPDSASAPRLGYSYPLGQVSLVYVLHCEGLLFKFVFFHSFYPSDHLRAPVPGAPPAPDQSCGCFYTQLFRSVHSAGTCSTVPALKVSGVLKGPGTQECAHSWRADILMPHVADLGQSLLFLCPNGFVDLFLRSGRALFIALTIRESHSG